MRFFFDTEFHEDGKIIDLISIGIVSENGHRYYAETDFAREKCQSDWLKINVLPKLIGIEKSRSKIALEIIKFMGSEPEIWAYYADYDWVVLCQLYGTMMALPKSWPMYCRDVKQLCDSLDNPKLPKQEQEHNALDDAIWVKDAWNFLMKLKSNGDPYGYKALAIENLCKLNEGGAN